MFIPAMWRVIWSASWGVAWNAWLSFLGHKEIEI